jgi:hypothetical protein
LRHTIAIAAVAILGFVPLGSLTAQSVMPAPPAPSGYYPDANWDLPPLWVIAIVRSKGLEPLGHPQRQGAAYALRAVDPADREVQVTVDARSGRILGVTPTAGATGPGLHPIRSGADEPAHNPRAPGAPRPNVAPAAKLKADAGGSKSGAEAAPPRPRPKVVERSADAASLSASAEAPAQAAPGPELEE